MHNSGFTLAAKTISQVTLHAPVCTSPYLYFQGLTGTETCCRGSFTWHMLSMAIHGSHVWVCLSWAATGHSLILYWQTEPFPPCQAGSCDRELLSLPKQSCKVAFSKAPMCTDVSQVFFWRTSLARGWQMWTLAWTLISHRGWPPAGERGQIFCNDSQQVSALRRAILQGIGITVVSLDLTLVKVTKKEQEAGQQVSVRSAVCSQCIYLG